MGKRTTIEDIMEALEANHIWINKVRLINPDDDFAKQLGWMIIDKLKDKDYLLPDHFDEPEEGFDEDLRNRMQELAELTPMLYLRINAS